MKYRLAAAVFVPLAVALGTLQTGCAAERPSKDTPAGMATIILPGALDRAGVAEPKAIAIVNREKLSALESFFPNYRQRPTSNWAAGWIEGYRVYFDVPGGETIKVSVSDSPDRSEPDLWSTGKGDFETNGDFKAFIEGLGKEDRSSPAAPATRPAKVRP